MKKTFSNIIASLTVAIASALFLGVTPVAASEPVESKPTIPPTFSEEISEDNELAKFRFGQNLLFAGNNVTVNAKGRGLLFAFGNQLQLGSESEYAFIAGNLINYSATTEKDLFIAGNTIDLKDSAKIGRDVYATGFRVVLASDLKGDFSAAANQVVLRDVAIAGNVNLDAATVAFEGEVTIGGTLSYNQDAGVSGLDRVKAGSVVTYVPDTHEWTATELWLSKLTTIISLSILAIFILALSARVREQVAGTNAVQNFGVNLIAGFVTLLAVPILAVLLLLSYFAAPLGIIMIFAYIALIYLAQALAGAWLGHALISKLLGTQTHVFIEAIVGIAILICCSMIPGLNIIFTFLATLLGVGIIVAAIRNKTTAQPVFAAPVEIAETRRAPRPSTTKSSRQSAKPAKTAKSSAQATKSSTKASKTTKSRNSKKS